MKIREHYTDVLEIVAWREIYDYLETAPTPASM